MLVLNHCRTQGPRNLTATAPIFTPAAPSTAASFNPAAPTSYIAPSQHSLPAAQYGYLEQHILYLRTQAQQFNSAILSQEAMQQDTRVARQQYNEIPAVYLSAPNPAASCYESTAAGTPSTCVSLHVLADIACLTLPFQTALGSTHPDTRGLHLLR